MRVLSDTVVNGEEFNLLVHEINLLKKENEKLYKTLKL
jgi:hypothetical protein